MALASIDARVIFEIFDDDKNQVLDTNEMDHISIFIRAKMNLTSPINKRLLIIGYYWCFQGRFELLKEAFFES